MDLFLKISSFGEPFQKKKDLFILEKCTFKTLNHFSKNLRNTKYSIVILTNI